MLRVLLILFHFCLCPLDAIADTAKHRALHLVIKNTEPDEIKRLVNQANDSGYTTIILGIYNGVKFDSVANPEKSVRLWSKDEYRSVVEYAKRLGLEVIPEVKLLTHQEHLLKNSRQDLMYNPATYNPANDKVYNEVVFPLLDEIIETLNPKALLIGHDEVAGHNENTRRKWLHAGDKVLPADLFLKDVRRIHQFLNNKNIETWMWGDMLFSEIEFPDMLSRHLHGNNYGYGKQLRDALPRDIVICDWHYFDEQATFPTIDTLNREGFRVLGATWKSMETTDNFSRYAANHGAKGMIATTWIHVQHKEWNLVEEIISNSGKIFRRDFSNAR